MADDARSTIDGHLRYPWREQQSTTPRICAWPGCVGEGLHRAPRSRQHLREFVWFCLDHVREYNRQWDFFAGMSADEIDGHRRADTTWHRPTWRFGTAWGGAGERWSDPFRMFDDDPPERPARPQPEAARMMAILELQPGFTLADLRRHYKAMVKRWHPDLHGGDKAAEERLRVVIEAYRYLSDHRLYVPG